MVGHAPPGGRKTSPLGSGLASLGSTTLSCGSGLLLPLLSSGGPRSRQPLPFARNGPSRSESADRTPGSAGPSHGSGSTDTPEAVPLSKGSAPGTPGEAISEPRGGPRAPRECPFGALEVPRGGARVRCRQGDRPKARIFHVVDLAIARESIEVGTGARPTTWLATWLAPPQKLEYYVRESGDTSKGRDS